MIRRPMLIVTLAVALAQLLGVRAAGASAAEDTYVSPTYGYRLTWDDTTWTVVEESSAGSKDRLTLSNGVSLVFVGGYPDPARDDGACLETMVDELHQADGLRDVEQARSKEGQALAGSDRLGDWAVYLAADPGAAVFGVSERLAISMRCRVLEPGAGTLQVVHVVAVDDYNGQVEPMEQLLSRLVVPKRQRPTPTPTVTAEARQDDGATAAPPLGASEATAGSGNVPMFRGDAARTGGMPGPGPSGEPEVRWRLDLVRQVHASPAVVDGVVYVGSFEANNLPAALYALDAVTGEERWRFVTGGGHFSSPAVVDGTVYVGHFNGYVYALDATTGQERWNVYTGTLFVTSSPAVADGVVYVGADDGNV